MSLLGGALIVAAVGIAAWFLTGVIERTARQRNILQLVQTFAPAVAAAREDPKALLAWYPLAQAARRIFPDECRRLDEARGAAFPFTSEDVQAAHARCTSDWLAWERTHDAEYKLKASAVEEEVARGPEAGTAVGRARVNAVEREKLERYQARYEEYIRTAKALQALIDQR
jgi:hypothetical protein